MYYKLIIRANEVLKEKAKLEEEIEMLKQKGFLR